MDWLEFISSLVSSLAWPVALIVMFLLLRKPIVKLLPHLKSLKYKDLEVDFGAELEKVETEVTNLPEAVRQLPQPPIPGSDDHFREVARLAPVAAIVEAWIPVEKEMLRLTVSDTARKSTGLKSLERLERMELVGSHTAQIIRELRHLRNIAAHGRGGYQITYDEALRYKEMADNVVAILRSIEGQGS